MACGPKSVVNNSVLFHSKKVFMTHSSENRDCSCSQENNVEFHSKVVQDKPSTQGTTL